MDINSKLTAQDCQLSVGFCVLVIYTSELLHCTATDCAQLAYSLYSGAVGRLKICKSIRDAVGLYCEDATAVDVQNCEFRYFAFGSILENPGPSSATVSLLDFEFIVSGPVPSCTDVDLLGVERHGACVGSVAGRGLSSSMIGCVVAGALQSCVALCEEAKASLERCELKQAKQGYGIEASNPGTELEQKSCRLAGNFSGGAVSTAAALLTAERIHSCQHRSKLFGYMLTNGVNSCM